MRVDPSRNFRLIFTLNPDSEIGPVIEPYVVQLNSNDSLSLTYQKLYSHTMKPFSDALDDNDREIIRLTTEYGLENLARKFCAKEVRPHEFVTRYLDDKLLKENIRPFVEGRIASCMSLLAGKTLYLRGKSGNPAHKLLEYESEEVSVFFHFIREEEGTRYYPTFRCRDEKLSFVNKEVMLLTNQPCLLLSENKLYRFTQEIEGKKLTPFFSKWNIQIPKSSEPQYFRRFVSQLIEKYKVVARGFEIHLIEQEPIPQLRLEFGWNNQPQLLLYFDYRKENIAASEERTTFVKLEKNEDTYTYYKITRRLESEKRYRQVLYSFGLQNIDGAIFHPPCADGTMNTYQLVEWLNQNRDSLMDQGIQVVQDGVNGKFFLGEIKLNISVEEKTDWFDVYAMVMFGEFRVPFVKLKKYILNGISEFPLPNGMVAVIPQEWFSMYREILALASPSDEETLVLKKHHFALVDEIFKAEEKVKIEKSFIHQYQELSNTEKDDGLPPEFANLLRPYQREGFRWMRFLRESKFGGCLADDMGLGKTLQTLAVLKAEKESGDTEEYVSPDPGQLSLFASTNQVTVRQCIPSLIIMPTSLIHNWQYEVKKWAPELRVVIYAGLDRSDKLRQFRSADLILTTYGTARNDIEILQNFEFNYIILDESQVIKNPMAKVSKAVKALKSRHRLGLSGTPIENSLTDLWSQMAFLNPGLLGSYQFFRDEFAIPIEKKNDDIRKQKLKALIKPFLLRRTKEQVAKELPELTEKYYFCEMTPEQKELYEQTRNFYRKKILESLEAWGETRAQFFILRGLMQLRLIANHPAMQDPNFDGVSGKFQDITSNLENLLQEKHRILVFSQFVRHLDLLAAWLQKQGIPYNYLTGQTRLRAQEINDFKQNDDRQVFLISLKAGGVGLTLTEADYVFICDPWWNPAAEQQAINRAHRIGQDKRVFAYKFITKDTVEEKIMMLQERKLRLSADLIQSTKAFDKNLSREDIELLFS